MAVPAPAKRANGKPAPLIVAGQHVSIVFEETEGHKAFPAIALSDGVYLGDKIKIRVPDGREFKARVASKTVVHLILPQ